MVPPTLAHGWQRVAIRRSSSGLHRMTSPRCGRLYYLCKRRHALNATDCYFLNLGCAKSSQQTATNMLMPLRICATRALRVPCHYLRVFDATTPNRQRALSVARAAQRSSIAPVCISPTVSRCLTSAVYMRALSSVFSEHVGFLVCCCRARVRRQRPTVIMPHQAR